MTICGAIVRHDIAVLWADTELFKGAVPQGHVNKITVNGGGTFAVTAAGPEGLCRAGAEVATRAVSLDDAAARIGFALRAKAERMLRDPHMDPRRVADHCTFLAGWSPRSGRLVGCELNGTVLFASALVSHAASPWIDAVGALDPDDLYALARVARLQLDALRADLPDARGGVLTVALIRPGQITSGILFRFEDAPGVWLWPGLASLERAEATEDAEMPPEGETALAELADLTLSSNQHAAGLANWPTLPTELSLSLELACAAPHPTPFREGTDNA